MTKRLPPLKRPRNPVNMSYEDEKIMMQMYNEGASIKELSERFGLKYSSMKSKINNRGYSTKGRE